jgi:hypothetical protein
MKTSFFYQVKEPSTIVSELDQFVQNNRELAHWTPLDYQESHWDACLEVPGDILDQDPFLVWLRSKVPFTGGILRMAPWTTYAWHRDYQRGCSLNLLLSDITASKCLFRHSPSAQIHGMFRTVEVLYSQTQYMCLNTQIEHSVFNWSQERFILTLHFLQTLEEFTYKDLLKLVLSRR